MQLSAAVNYSVQHSRLVNFNNFTACVLKTYIHPTITTDKFTVILYIYIYIVFTALLTCFYMIQNTDKIPHIILPPTLELTLALKCFLPMPCNQKLNMPSTADNLPYTLHFGAFGKSTVYCKGWMSAQKKILV